MKTWRQILSEVGLVPPEQTMRDQEELIAHIGEIAFCTEYLEVAQESGNENLLGLTWQDILQRRTVLRHERERELGLYQPNEGKLVDDEEYCYAQVQFRDCTAVWCEVDVDDIERDQMVHVRLNDTAKIAVGSVMQVRYLKEANAPVPVEYMHTVIDVIDSFPRESELFYAFSENIKRGLQEYEKSHPGKLPKNFYDELIKNIDAFGQGESSEPFVFSAGLRNAEGIDYIGIDIEENVISINKGGSAYTPEVGSDSYTSWTYSIWNNGHEDSSGVGVMDLDYIYSYLSDPDVDFRIEQPDEFVYSLEHDDDNYEEVPNKEGIQNIIQYIPNLEQAVDYGHWVFPEKSPEGVSKAPYVQNEKITFDVLDAVFDYARSVPELGLPIGYINILQKNNIVWSDNGMAEADVSNADVSCILALLIGVANAERFSDGTIVRFFSNGCVLRWLKRLEQLIL